MIDLFKDVLGVATSDYDVYLVVIVSVCLGWILKTVINGFFQTVLHIFR